MSADVRLHISGSFPSTLYKGFAQKYAHLFLDQGSFMMRSLYYYQVIEDQNRRDKSEGEGKAVIFKNRPVLKIDQKSGETLSQTEEYGPVYFSTLSTQPRYILCLSGPEVDVKYLASQYGGYVVRLNQPNKLVCDIASYLKKYSNITGTMWLDCIQVKYNKDQPISELPEPASKERLRMSYGQKDPTFSDDCEYRLVLTLPPIEIPPTEINIELQKKLEYAELVYPETDK
jgi:hypothetical protein